jgi:hypothetical protein
MDEWFSMISGGRQFPALAAKELQDAGWRESARSRGMCWRYR